ncbi:MAG: type II toxin-antitoxin system RelE/ParE family toxin [Luteimonas sp.]|nr:type II toxin-antitoxin system RelE/ParE family toxin [Luteimonas sp.]
MKALKAIVPRALANRDIDEAIDHYLVEASEKVALGFVDELEKAYGHLARQPASGSPRYAHQLGIADLRFWSLRRYPYLVFYVERDEYIDVWRVLHEQRDIPAWMNEV